MAKLADLSDALARVLGGGTVLDPEVVSALFAQRRRRDPLAELSPREPEVMGLMAEGRPHPAQGTHPDAVRAPTARPRARR